MKRTHHPAADIRQATPPGEGNLDSIDQLIEACIKKSALASNQFFERLAFGYVPDERTKLVENSIKAGVDIRNTFKGFFRPAPFDVRSRPLLPDLSKETVINPPKMKIAYIAHPIGGDVQGNLGKIRNIVREINLKEPNVVPFVPYFVDCVALRDDIPEERARGIKNGLALLRGEIVDELRLYGPKITPGMNQEIMIAHEMKIPIRIMSEEIMKNNVGGADE